MQHIYPISKQEVSMNLDCNFQVIYSVDAPATDVQSPDWQQGNATDN